MKKSLVIVESPAKARTISKFLGEGFEVTSCMGHVVDLPQKKLGIDVDDNFKASYVVIPKKKKLLKELKKQAKGKEMVYFATDPDREGEAIGWNIKEQIGVEDERSKRVVFHEITKRAIEEAFKEPKEFDIHRIQAQQARRVLDRIVGYLLSPLLWKKVSRGLSAGRVQSVALRLVVEREREIQKFVPQEFWKITAQLQKKGLEKTFSARLEKINDKKIQINNKDESDNLVEKIKKEVFCVDDIQIQQKKRSPLAPFVTSTLQQEAFNKLGFSTTKTMILAQQLYEGVELGKEGAIGLITYMRTDSTKISQVAIEEIRKFILDKYGKDFLPAQPNIYKTQKAAQEAHEAIRPTDALRQPQDVRPHLTEEQYKLYELIWKRAVASQMITSLYEYISVDIKAGEFLFKSGGSKLIFSGFEAVYHLNNKEEEDEESLPDFSLKEELSLNSIMPTQHFTKPPAHYSEGSLVKALEENGVGRPSTYAPTIQTITARDYVRRNKGYLYPTELGFKVSDLLVENFPETINVEFTAHMEEDLDKVEEGNYNWVVLLNKFYQPFQSKVEIAKTTIKKEIVYSEKVCKECGKQMIVKWGRKGQFLSCSDYPKCKYSESITTDLDCPEAGCGGKLIERKSYRGRVFYGCSNFPRCKFTSSQSGFKPLEKKSDSEGEKPSEKKEEESG